MPSAVASVSGTLFMEGSLVYFVWECERARKEREIVASVAVSAPLCFQFYVTASNSRIASVPKPFPFFLRGSKRNPLHYITAFRTKCFARAGTLVLFDIITLDYEALIGHQRGILNPGSF